MSEKFRYQMKAKAQANLRREMIRKLYESGQTWKQIADTLRISPQRAQQLGKAR